MPHPHIVPWDDARKRTHERGFSLPFIGPATGAEKLAVHLSVIKAGEAAHPPHVHDDEEVIFLIDGTAEITMGDEKEVVEGPAAALCKPGTLHGLRNAGDRDMRYLIIRAS